MFYFTYTTTVLSLRKVLDSVQTQLAFKTKFMSSAKTLVKDFGFRLVLAKLDFTQWTAGSNSSESKTFHYLHRQLPCEDIVTLGVRLSHCVSVRRAMHAALVSAAKVMGYATCDDLYSWDHRHGRGRDLPKYMIGFIGTSYCTHAWGLITRKSYDYLTM